MKKVGLFIATAVMLMLFAFSASAAKEGYYTYEISGEEATITGSSSISGDVTIPSTLGGYKVTSIGKAAFSYCKNLTSVTIPDSVTSINGYAFRYCSNLISVIIGDSVTSIGNHAFYDCSSLTNVTIPNSVTSIGNDAFSGCSSLTSVTIPDSVTNIGDYAFSGCSSLTSVTIPDSVTNIGDYAFSGCSNLINVIVDKENKYYCNDEYGVLFDKNKTELIRYPAGNKLAKYIIPDSVTIIGVAAFSGCSSLTSVAIPDSVTNIGNSAFFDCSSLTSVAIPDSVTTIGYSAFFDCSSLESVTIPDSVTTIGDDAFFDCSSLESVTIPDSVTSIGNWTFNGCSCLTSVTIPDSVTIIGSYAFYGCSNLDDVYYTGTESQWTAIRVDSYNYSLKNATIHYNTCVHKNIIDVPQQKNTCTKVGYTSGKQCSKCNIWLSGHEEIPELGHSYSSIFTIDTAATCTVTGSKSKHCTNTDCTSKTDETVIPATGHTYGKYTTDKKATCTTNGLEQRVCSNCNDIEKTTIPKLGHSYFSIYTTDKKATLSANGSKSRHCTRDGCITKTSVTAIAKISSATLSTASCTYNGKTRNPSIIVKDSEGNTLAKGTDYTVTIPSGRKNPGEYEYVITFMGNYSGEKRLTFTILPKAPVRISATQSTSVIKLSWSESVGATGYRVYQYSPAKGKYVQIASVKGVNSYRKATNLKPGTEYSFKIKPYTKLSDGTVLWGTASEAFVTATECKAPVIKSVTSPSKQKATVKWSDVSGETGYQVYYSTKKDSGFKKYANSTTNSCYVKNLTSGKTYYFKVRTYIKTDSGYVYSAWSNVKGIKIK